MVLLVLSQASPLSGSVSSGQFRGLKAEIQTESECAPFSLFPSGRKVSFLSYHRPVFQRRTDETAVDTGTCERRQDGEDDWEHALHVG